MKYVLLDSTGNLIDAFDAEEEARATLERIVQQDPEAAGDVALIVYDEAGVPAGPAVTLARPSTPPFLEVLGQTEVEIFQEVKSFDEFVRATDQPAGEIVSGDATEGDAQLVGAG